MPKKGKHKHANRTVEPEVKAVSTSSALLGEPPILPPGTYSTTESVRQSKPSYKQVYEIESALAAKQQALDTCSLMIDSAVEELVSMATAGDQFWHQVKRLKNGTTGRDQWAIVPKPDFARSMVVGEMARDIIIPYTTDEGEELLYSRS